MIKWRKIFAEILDEITCLALFYGIFATMLFAYSKDVLDLRRAALLAVPFVLNFFLRRITRFVAVSLAIHLIVPVVFLAVMPFGMYTLIWAVGLLGLAVYSALYPFKSQATSTAAFNTTTTILFVALTLWAGNRDYWALAATYLPLVVIIILGRHMLLRMMQMNKSLEAIQSTSQTPTKKILSFDYKVAIGLVVLILSMTVVFYVFLIAPTLRVAVDIFPGLPQFAPLDIDAEPDRIPLSPGGMDVGTIQYLMGEDNSTVFTRLLGLLLRVVFSIMAIMAVAALFVFAIRAIIKFVGMRTSRVKQLKDADGLEDEKEFIFPVEKWRKQRRKIFALNEHPVRRQFRETAVRHIKNGVPIVKADTPTEISRRIKTENLTALVEEYGEVRYSESANR